jgi:hypothetical protein
VSHNDLSMAYRIRRRPRGVSVLDAIRVMRDALDGDGELPDDYDVIWGWRNSPSQDLREDDFGTAVTASRSSFVTLMRRRLDRDIARLELLEPPPPPTRDRSAAARKGWETRRRRAAERESQRRRRSARAAVAAAKRKRKPKRRKGRKR